jgi:hypothetical protein
MASTSGREDGLDEAAEAGPEPAVRAATATIPAISHLLMPKLYDLTG